MQSCRDIDDGGGVNGLVGLSDDDAPRPTWPTDVLQAGTVFDIKVDASVGCAHWRLLIQ